MPRDSKVEHKCMVPAAERQWDRMESIIRSVEIWKCRSCGYEFEIKRVPRRHGSGYPYTLPRHYH